MTWRQGWPVGDEALDPRDPGHGFGREASLVVLTVNVDLEALRFERLGQHCVGAPVLGADLESPEAMITGGRETPILEMK